MAKLILKSIAYYPQALAELPMSHKDLGLIDTDKPYKKLIIPTKSRHLYRLVDQQTGEVLKAQKLIRDHNDLKVYVGDVSVFSAANINAVEATQTITGLTFTVSGLLDASNEKISVDGSNHHHTNRHNPRCQYRRGVFLTHRLYCG